MPYRLTVRVAADLLVIALLLWLGTLAGALAQAGPLSTPDAFPWREVIQAALTVLTAVVVWLVKGQVTELHTTINSKMDRLLELTASASKAEGAKEERDRADIASAAASAAADQARRLTPTERDLADHTKPFSGNP